ncbi:hypothetical protein D3C86_1822870 [compost metagenome]
MLFNQAVFQQPGINFSINNGKCDLSDSGNQYPGLPVHLVVLIEIRAYTVSEVFGFADIN